MCEKSKQANTNKVPDDSCIHLNLQVNLCFYTTKPNKTGKLKLKKVWSLSTLLEALLKVLIFLSL